MKENVEPIDSDLPLAKAFNRILSKIETIRIMSTPRVFDDSRGEMAAFKMQNFYESLLWEKWLHGVWKRLEEWPLVINDYFDEYDGSWKYYACSKRLDFIKEWGSDDEEDYNPDGSIKTEGITQEQLKYHTVFRDLYFDGGVDIVQDTTPNDLESLICSLGALSKFSIVDVLQDVSGKQVPTYVVDGCGGLRQANFADKAERRLNDTIEADDLGTLVYRIAQFMDLLMEKIKNIVKTDCAFSDNHKVLNALLHNVYALIHLRLDEFCEL